MLSLEFFHVNETIGIQIVPDVMKEPSSTTIDGFEIKRVVLFIQSALTPLSGYWQWDMASAAVFCSDVMLGFPTDFEGTKAIVHPEDLSLVRTALEELKELKQVNLQFRIITTYNEVKTLTGQHVFIDDIDPSEQFDLPQQPFAFAQEQKEQKTELAVLRQKQQLFEEAGKIAGTGFWYYNKNTQEAYYSDQVYLFHGLAPQSLNAHLNSFVSFIHPQDRDIVIESLNKAYTEELPLQLEYRIITTYGGERYVRNVLQWTRNTLGEYILHGSLQEYTQYKEAEAFEEHIVQKLWFQQQQLLFLETNSHTGFWQLDIVTRKFSPSDNFYRILGLKPHSIGSSINFFINYIHPDDRALVEHYYQALRKEHTANDIEYRIIRPDGKQRYIRQQAKSMIEDKGNLVLFGLIQDISTVKDLEHRLKEKTENYQFHQYGQSIAESLVHTGTWRWDQESSEQYWSDGMYQLFGYKPQSVALSQRHLLVQIHPEYRKHFTDSLTLTLREEQDSNFEITISRNGEPRQLKAAFKLFHYEEKRVFIGIFQDITKEKVLQQALSERIQLADLLTENLPDRVFITDSENNVLFWNKQCEKYFRQKRDQVIGRNFFESFPILQTEERIREFNDVLRGQAVHKEGIQTALSKDIFDLHMLPLHNQEKEVIGILHLLHDVTEGTALRQSLTERLHFIESLIEASVDRVVALDRHMNYMYWNKRAEEYYDLKKEKVLGKNILEIFPAFVNDPSFGEFRKALRGETVHIGSNATDSFQQGQHFETYLIPVKDDKEEVTAILWITHDLSKDYLLAQQQRKSNEILNTSNAIFIELDFDYRFTYLNRKAEEFLQRPSSEMLGLVLWELFPEGINTEGYYAIVTACRDRVKRETEYYSEVFHRWMYLSATPSPEGVNVFMIDRQDIRETQLKLQESEDLLRRSEEVAHTGSYEADIATMNFRFSNGLFRLFGEEPQSFEPTMAFIDSRTHPDDVPVVKRIIDQAIADKQSYYYTRRIYRTDGELRTLESHGNVVCDSNDNVIKIISLVQDITERQQAEVALHHHQQLIKATLDSAYYMVQVLQAIRNDEGQIIDFQWLLLNDPAELLYGPVTGERLLVRHPGVIPSQLFEKYVQVTETGVPMQFETAYNYEHIRGWHEMSVVQLEDGIVITSADISERKKAEAELQKSLTLLQQSEDIAGIGSWEYDIPTRTLTLSEGMYRMFEMKPGIPVKPSTYVNIAIPEDQIAAQRIVDHLTKDFLPFEETIQATIAGQHKVIKSKGTVVYNETGQPQKMLGIDMDITGIMQANKEIRKSEHFLQQVTDTAPDAITVFDLQLNKATYINPKVIESILGYTVGELQAMGFEGRLKKIIHPEDQDKIVSFNEHFRHSGNGVVLTQEYRIITKQGQTKWLANRGKAFTSTEDGHPKMILSVLQDITQQKEAALELQENKQFIEEIMNATLDFIMIFDFTVNHITYVNRQAFREDEARYQETLSLSYEGIIERAHPEDRKELHEFIQSFKELPDQEVRTYDFREIREKETLWFRSRGKVFKRDEKGNVLQYISVVQDISNEKALYQQLAERTAFAEAVVESSVDAIIVLDTAYSVRSWNRRCEQLYNLSKEKALYSNLFTLFPKIAEDATLMNAFHRAMHGEFMYLPAKLSVYTNRMCEFFYVPLKNEDGEVYGVLNIIHDVSRQEEYASALQEMNLLLQQQNVELEQRNEEIATFAFVASHDLKEPLRKIHTFSDWLLERENERLSQKGQDFLKRLNQSVYRLNMLIDDILVLTKIHTDTRNNEDVNLNEIIKAVEEDLNEIIAQTRTSIITEPLPTITSNRNQLFYLFRNLIHNAIKFQQPGAKPFIEISADLERNVNHPHAQPKQEYLKISIHDNGIGFDQKYVRKIFKMFQQLHARGEYAGTGMGLAICRKIMENNKGFIAAESVPGEGSVFYCYFPLY